MPRRWVALLIAVLALAPVAEGQDATFTIQDSKVFPKPSRPGVGFTHQYHEALGGGNCLLCHHRMVNGKNVLDVKELVPGNPAIACSSCHTTARSLQSAYHNQCITCHVTTVRQGKGSPPRACGECHKWGS